MTQRSVTRRVPSAWDKRCSFSGTAASIHPWLPSLRSTSASSSSRASRLRELVELGTLTAQAAEFLDACVVAGLNIVWPAARRPISLEPGPLTHRVPRTRQSPERAP